MRPALPLFCLIASCSQGPLNRGVFDSGLGDRSVVDGSSVADAGSARYAAVDISSTTRPDLALTPCANGIRDGMESDVDCGGGACAPCATGRGCRDGADCDSGF